MKSLIKNITLSAMFLALGMILPFFTGQIRQIGNMLLPMHFPVFLCGLICGWPYGLTIGFILPLFRSFTFSMPVLFPTATSMAFELATYGFLSGFFYNRSRHQCIVALYRSLVLSMLSGRLVWGMVQYILLGLSGKGFTWAMFLAGAFLNAIPGICLQLILIPAIMVTLKRAGLVKLQDKKLHMIERKEDHGNHHQ